MPESLVDRQEVMSELLTAAWIVKSWRGGVVAPCSFALGRVQTTGWLCGAVRNNRIMDCRTRARSL